VIVSALNIVLTKNLCLANLTMMKKSRKATNLDND